MLKDLQAFKRKHGHCNVPTNCDENPRLGRWVASQRHKQRLDELSETRVAQLDQLGFVWSPSERAWEKMFRRLATYRKSHGHCNVSDSGSGDAELAYWVQQQRVRYRNGKIDEDRKSRLERLGFEWVRPRGRKPECAEASGSRDIEEEEAVFRGQRLYYVEKHTYIQGNGNGEVPPEVQAYMASHRGESPPFIPLPEGPVEFRLGLVYLRPIRVRWNGRSKLPEKVLDYVRANGNLPAYVQK